MQLTKSGLPLREIWTINAFFFKFGLGKVCYCVSLLGVWKRLHPKSVFCKCLRETKFRFYRRHDNSLKLCSDYYVSYTKYFSCIFEFIYYIQYSQNTSSYRGFFLPKNWPILYVNVVNLLGKVFKWVNATLTLKSLFYFFLQKSGLISAEPITTTI